MSTIRETLMICAALFAASANVCAFTVNDGMRIVVPDAEQTGIARAINDAAKELAANIKESTGLAVKVSPASKAGNANRTHCFPFLLLDILDTGKESPRT